MFRRLRGYVGIFLTVASLGLGTPVGAIDESFYMGNNIFYYNPTDTGATCSNSTTNVQAGSLDSFLQALAKQESGGNPTAANPASSARGKYQYITSTWQSRYSLFPPAKDYPTADKAPESVQDAVAYIEYAQKWKSFDGSIFKLAISHFLPAANQNEALLDVVPPQNSITPRQYANSVVDKVNNGYGSEIPLTYSTAPDFQKYLEKAVGGAADFSNSAPVSTTPGTGCSSSSSGGGVLGEGGLTEEQAKILMMNYGDNKGGDTEKTIGASYWADCAPGGHGSNCVSFSRFFINKFTSTKAPTPMGNGADVVDHLKAIGVPTGNAPKLYSVFSMSSSDPAGHTGVVLGIHGDQIIVGHASCGRGGQGIGGRGDGTLNGNGSGFIIVGSISKKTGFYARGWPTKFAYPQVDENKIQAYING